MGFLVVVIESIRLIYNMIKYDTDKTYVKFPIDIIAVTISLISTDIIALNYSFVKIPLLVVPYLIGPIAVYPCIKLHNDLFRKFILDRDIKDIEDTYSAINRNTVELSKLRMS